MPNLTCNHTFAFHICLFFQVESEVCYSCCIMNLLSMFKLPDCFLFCCKIKLCLCSFEIYIKLCQQTDLCVCVQVVYDTNTLYVFAPSHESRSRWVQSLKEGQSLFCSVKNQQMHIYTGVGYESSYWEFRHLKYCRDVFSHFEPQSTNWFSHMQMPSSTPALFPLFLLFLS